jgi:hypothetical protein
MPDTDNQVAIWECVYVPCMTMMTDCVFDICILTFCAVTRPGDSIHVSGKLSKLRMYTCVDLYTCMCLRWKPGVCHSK